MNSWFTTIASLKLVIDRSISVWNFCVFSCKKILGQYLKVQFATKNSEELMLWVVCRRKVEVASS